MAETGIQIANTSAGNIESIDRPVSPVVPPVAAVAVNTSAASGLSAIGKSISNAFNKIINPTGQKLPLPNPFDKYASYNYIFTLFAVTADGSNNPDDTYMKGFGKFPIVLRSGSGYPDNRINTDLGKFEFYLDDVVIKTKYAFEPKTGNSHAYELDLIVTEPYSMGTFMLALTQAAKKAGWDTHMQAHWCLAIQFMGEDQLGSYSSIPKTTKYYTLQLSDIALEINEGGTKYIIKAKALSESALHHSTIKLTSEISFYGSTVAEVLQTGPKSLSAVYNQRLRNIATDNNIPVADEIVIVFPTDISSEKSSASSGTGNTETKSSATTTTYYENNGAASSSTGTSTLYDLAGVARSTDGAKNLYQTSAVNKLGLANLGYNPAREGVPDSPGSSIYDEKNYSWDQSKISIDPNASTFQISQNSTIINAINQVLLNSDYAKNVLSQPTDQFGMRDMWAIIPSVYTIKNPTNAKYTGQPPRLFVYSVVPYSVHSSAQPVPGLKVDNTKYQALLNQCAKAYDYIYTGKNTQIKKLDLKINSNFKAILPQDNNRSSLSTLSGQQNSALDTKGTDIVFQGGSTNNNPAKGWDYLMSFMGTRSNTDKKGSAGEESEQHRAARYFFDAMMYGKDIAELQMDIVGDPYWMASSGTGNYRAKETENMNVNSDLSANIHNGEVDMIVRFKTPSDINSSTGLYNLNGSKALLQWSGLYKVKEVHNIFRNGEFYQTIWANKRPIYPYETSEVVYNTSKTQAAVPVDATGQPVGNNGWGEA